MSRQLEQRSEERTRRRREAILQAVNGGLSDGVSVAGGELLGFSVRLNRGDCLITLRVRMPAGRFVAYVGGETLGDCLVKGTREARTDLLKWLPDKYAKK